MRHTRSGYSMEGGASDGGGGVLGRAEPDWPTAADNRRGSRAEQRRMKKEEFPGPMGCMMLGNSFPQICVVSVPYSVDKQEEIQGHERIRYLSNLVID